MPYKNYALEWYQYGLKNNDDAIVKFMMHWIAFNWLYGEYKTGIETSEKSAITRYCEHNYDKLSRFDAFSRPEIDVFLDKPVEDINRDDRSGKARERYNSLKCDRGLKQFKSLILTIYQVRCNLFHGSKSLQIDRDVELVRASSIILEGYLRTVITNID